VSRATTNVAPKRPVASWLNRSDRSAPTIRGKNCPIASCTTTSVTVSTRLIREAVAVATTDRVVCASLGVPVTLRGTRV
jgi:hypothetical protein